MTTIAYRQGIMAADSFAGGGDVFDGSAIKLRQLADGGVLGFSGELSMLEHVVAWVERGANAYEPPPVKYDEDATWTALIAYPTHVVYVEHTWRTVRLDAEYHASGIGRQFALGAMANGASAEKAVIAACQHSIHTRLPVITMKVKGWQRQTKS